MNSKVKQFLFTWDCRRSKQASKCYSKAVQGEKWVNGSAAGLQCELGHPETQPSSLEEPLLKAAPPPDISPAQDGCQQPEVPSAGCSPCRIKQLLLFSAGYAWPSTFWPAQAKSSCLNFPNTFAFPPSVTSALFCTSSALYQQDKSANFIFQCKS